MAHSSLDTQSLASEIERALRENATRNIRRVRPREQRALAQKLAEDFLAQLNEKSISPPSVETTGREMEKIGLSIDSILSISSVLRNAICSVDEKDAESFQVVETYTNTLVKSFFEAWMDKLRREAEITSKAWKRIPDEKK